MGNSSRKRRTVENFQRAPPSPIVQQAPPPQPVAAPVAPLPPFQQFASFPQPFFPSVNQFQPGGPIGSFPTSFGFGSPIPPPPVCPPRFVPFSFAGPSFPQFAPQLQLPPPPPPPPQQLSFISAPPTQLFAQYQPAPQLFVQPALPPRPYSQVRLNPNSLHQTPFYQPHYFTSQPLPACPPPAPARPPPPAPVYNNNNCNQGIQHPPLRLPPLPRGVVSNQCSGIVQQGPPPQLSLPEGYQLVGVQELPNKVKTHQTEHVSGHSPFLIH